MSKIFIDGSAGTTGLRIRERLAADKSLELIVLSEAERKDPVARKKALQLADVAFLCLPDIAAREAVELSNGSNAVIIDTSTAHRTAEGWTYGFPEISNLRQLLVTSKRIANPGCHASGFNALVAPLVERGVLAHEVKLSAFSLTGYSGGGKKMIADYDQRLEAACQRGMVPYSASALATEAYMGGRQYALGQMHKHLPEMVKVCKLNSAPVFSPIVVPHLSGMEVTVALPGVELSAVRECYRAYYANSALVRYEEELAPDGILSSVLMCGRDDMKVSAFGVDGRVVAVAVFDNLGKGASGAAIQNMNIALGRDETKGLVLGD